MKSIDTKETGDLLSILVKYYLLSCSLFACTDCFCSSLTQRLKCRLQTAKNSWNSGVHFFYWGFFYLNDLLNWIIYLSLFCLSYRNEIAIRNAYSVLSSLPPLDLGPEPNYEMWSENGDFILLIFSKLFCINHFRWIIWFLT